MIREEIDRLNRNEARVLAYLRTHESATNVELCQVDVGGLAGCRRVRALRGKGYPIEKRHVSRGIWEYRLGVERGDVCL